MDKQDTLRNVLIAAAVFMLVMSIGPALLPQRPPAPNPNPTLGPPESEGLQPETDGPSPVAERSAPPSSSTPGTVGGREKYHVIEAEAVQEVALGASSLKSDGSANADSFRMRLTLTNRGASVARATLTDHASKVDEPDRYELLSPALGANGTEFHSFTVVKVNIDGVDVPLHDKLWHLGPVEPFSSTDAGGVDSRGQRLSFWTEVLEGEAPILKITRTLELPEQPVEAGRHDLWSIVTLENLSTGSRRVVVATRGGIGVPSVNGRGGTRNIDYGILNEGGQVVGERETEAGLRRNPGERKRLFLYSPQTPGQRLSWAATDNTYFTCTLAPVEADGRTAASYVAETAALDLDGDALTTEDAAIEFVTAPLTLEPVDKKSLRTAIYLGEKDAHAFRNVPDYRSRNYYYQIAQGFGFCTFTWLVELMIWLLNGLYFVVRDFGVAIIILVLIVRALLHPLTKKGQVNMVRMQEQMGELAPKMEEIKRKFANDKARLQQETMKLYRDQGINPAGQMLTCLPMFIQMPIWVALYLSLSNNILMRHQPLHFTWVSDLTAPDALIPFSAPFTIPLFGWKIASFNLLPILVAIFMYIQQKTQPKPEPNPNMSDQQRQQQEMMQKMMPLMSIMMLLIFYNMPSGLNLYIMCSSLFGWLEQRHIRTHIKQKKAAGRLHKTSAKSEDGPGTGTGESKTKPKPSWFERLQKAAEEAQKSQRTQRRPKPKTGR